MDKEVRELVDAIESGEHGTKGLTVVTEGKHAKIYFRDQVVHERLEGGEMGAPLTLPLTPSDPRWYENTIARLKRSRVLAEDPKKVAQRGLTPEQEAEREEERQRREGNQEQRQEEVSADAEDARERQSNTTLLRQRAERILDVMGVWKPSGQGKDGWRGTIAEVARVSFHWATENPTEGTLPTEVKVKDFWRRLYRDEPLVEEGRAFVNAFIDLLAKADNPTRFYHDLLRDALGIGETRAPAPPKEVGPEPQHAPPTVMDVVEAVKRLGGVVTPAQLANELPDMAKQTRHWATSQAAHLNMIQRLGRGLYAPLGYEPGEGEVEPNGDEPEPTAADDRPPISVDLEEEKQEMSTEEMQAVIGPVMDRLEGIAQDVQRLQEARSNGEAPTLALECLAEMVGQHITVGGGENGGIDDDVLALVDAKRERALALAKRVAALEVGGA